MKKLFASLCTSLKWVFFLIALLSLTRAYANAQETREVTKSERERLQESIIAFITENSTSSTQFFNTNYPIEHPERYRPHHWAFKYLSVDTDLGLLKVRDSLRILFHAIKKAGSNQELLAEVTTKLIGVESKLGATFEVNHTYSLIPHDGGAVLNEITVFISDNYEIRSIVGP